MGSENYRCACEGCKAEGFWIPAFVMKGMEDFSKEERAELTLTFCDAHRKSLVVLDILTDGVWSKMRKQFEQAGKTVPDRGSIELDFRHVYYGYFN